MTLIIIGIFRPVLFLTAQKIHNSCTLHFLTAYNFPLNFLTLRLYMMLANGASRSLYIFMYNHVIVLFGCDNARLIFLVDHYDLSPSCQVTQLILDYFLFFEKLLIRILSDIFLWTPSVVFGLFLLLIFIYSRTTDNMMLKLMTGIFGVVLFFVIIRIYQEVIGRLRMRACSGYQLWVLRLKRRRRITYQNFSLIRRRFWRIGEQVLKHS
jgi:hypothetical protein